MTRTQASTATSIALACALCSPGLDARLLDDDFTQAAYLNGAQPVSMPARSPFDLYRFFSGDEREMSGIVNSGAVPWWTDTRQRVAFFRPLTSALMVIDQRLWGDRTALFHIHSLVWAMAVVLIAATLARRLVPEPAPAVPALFVIGGAALTPVAWWAQRHVLVSAAFGLLAILAHVRRRDAPGGGAWARPILLLALSLAGGESGVQYVLALLGLCMIRAWRNGPVVPRGADGKVIAGSLALVVCYLLIWKAGGYGVASSALYVDPTGDPVGYLRNLGAIAAEGVTTALAYPVLGRRELMEAAALTTGNLTFVGAASALASLCYGLTLARSWRRADSAARTALAGAVMIGALAIVVAAGTRGNVTAGLLPGLCGAVVAAHVLLCAYRTVDGQGGRMARLSALICLALSTWLAARQAQGVWSHQRNQGRLQRTIADTLQHLPFDSAVDTVLAFRVPTPTPFVSPVIRSLGGRPKLRTWCTATTSQAPQSIARIDGHTLEVTARGDLLSGGYWYRASNRPWGGTPIDVPGIRVTVMSPSSSVSRVRFAFDRPIDDPRIALLEWQHGRGFLKITKPTVGQRSDLPSGTSVIR